MINNKLWHPKYVLENAYFQDKMDYENLVSSRMRVVADRSGKGRSFIHNGYEGLKNENSSRMFLKQFPFI